jgi:hypothetical protein
MGGAHRALWRMPPCRWFPRREDALREMIAQPLGCVGNWLETGGTLSSRRAKVSDLWEIAAEP